MNTLADLRREYTLDGLDERQVHEDPIVQFQRWFEDVKASEVGDPNAMTLATVSADGQPDARVVLLKGIEDGAFRFFTNYTSAKGQQLEAHPRAALLFYWGHLERQVRLRGPVHRLSEEASDAYFQSRPRGSQIGAWASDQSAQIAGREVLASAVERLQAQYPDDVSIPRPPHWGGFAVTPREIEFWQGRPNRLHDRLLYTKEDERWRLCRLSA
ncbi:MAG: pyridoxamine 5'-phosphate oxidase [Myxococcota bacterium]